MRNFKLFTMIFAIMVTVCFAACDDKDDNKQETNVCDPATCEMAANATEMACSDVGQCVVKACAETFKVAEDAKSCESVEPACECDPACKDSEDCVKGEDGACGCKAKEKPAACDPACEGNKECKCAEDKCECVEPAPAPTCDPSCNAETEDCVCAKDKCECKAKEAPAEECFCDDAKTVACPEGGKDACQADPSATENACKDKSENADCGENKTCQKGEGDKLECKDKPADPAPSEPAQPDKPE